MGTATMLHYPEPAATPTVARPAPFVSRTPLAPLAPHDIASALSSSPVHGSASVHVSEVMCRVGADERANGQIDADVDVISRAHHIVLPRDGALTCRVRHGTGARVIVDPAMALLVAPGQRVTVRNATPGDHAATVITVTPELLALTVGDAMDASHVAFGALVLSPAAMLGAQRVRCLATMIRDLRPWHPDTAVATLATATVALLRHLVPIRDRTLSATSADARRSPSRSARAAEAIRAIVAAEPGAQHTLDSVSTRVGISPFHLARVFHARTGFSIHQYLLHVRMARALLALGDGETSLSRLALALGFCSHSHFATTFRRHFGLSPRDVRATLRAWPTEPQSMDRCACVD